MDPQLRRPLENLSIKLREATEYVRGVSIVAPRAALILGSGFSKLIQEVEDSVTLRFEEIPHFPTSSVAGHAGELVLGSLHSVPLVIASGRKHLYEGEGLLPVLIPVLLCRSLGARTLMLTNAAGAAHADWEVGDAMLILDHIDSTFHAFTAPTRDIADASGLPLSSDPPACPYRPRLNALARKAAREADLLLREGIYVFSLGPYYETAAEVEALRRLGGDAFGMSTAPESLLAARLGMEVVAFSAITNLATGIAAQPHQHEQVLKNAVRAVTRISRMIHGILQEIATEPSE